MIILSYEEKLREFKGSRLALKDLLMENLQMDMIPEGNLKKSRMKKEQKWQIYEQIKYTILLFSSLNMFHS